MLGDWPASANAETYDGCPFLRYRIERELGAGGMATVYLAGDRKHKRKVAIKVLKPGLAAVLLGNRPAMLQDR